MINPNFRRASREPVKPKVRGAIAQPHNFRTRVLIIQHKSAVAYIKSLAASLDF